MNYQNTLEFAKEMDQRDPLKSFRDQFYFPTFHEKEVVYFTGNSLGLQPKRTGAYVNEIMSDWANLGVEGHFRAEKPWWDYHERLAKPLARIVGALEEEQQLQKVIQHLS